MSDPLLIYGATGHSGRLLARQACALGLRPILCGRSRSAVEALGAELGLEHRTTSVSDRDALDSALSGVRVVLNAAGPFSKTAEPILDTCIQRGVHYLDITGELAVVERLARRHGAARDRDLMVMPCVGFDVVPTDCLAAHVAGRIRRARHLFIAVTNLQMMTRGTAKTMLEAAEHGVVLRDGSIERVPLGSISRDFDFGDGPRAAMGVSLADTVTAYYTTGVPNVETYAEATPLLRGMLTSSAAFSWLTRTAPAQACLHALIDALPVSPIAGDFRANGSGGQTIVAEADDGRGNRARARLRTPEAYAFTAVTGATIAAAVLNGDLEPGFQTPARVYGSDFVLTLPGVTREDLE